MKDKVIRKNCISCKGSGTMYFDSFYAKSATILYRDYQYFGAFIYHKCKECNGVGIVNYKIKTISEQKD